MAIGVTSEGKLFFTAIAYMHIKGENNVAEFWFQNRYQYVYTEQEWRYRESDDDGGLKPDGDGNTHCWHYKVEDVNGLDHCWVPQIYTALEELRTIEEQSWRAWEENVIVDQPRDHIKVYKNLTGIDLAKRRVPGHNGYELWERSKTERFKNNGKQYGETIPKE